MFEGKNSILKIDVNLSWAERKSDKVTNGWGNRNNLIYLKYTNSRLGKKIRQLCTKCGNAKEQRFFGQPHISMIRGNKRVSNSQMNKYLEKINFTSVRKIIYWCCFNKFNYFSYTTCVTNNFQATNTRRFKIWIWPNHKRVNKNNKLNGIKLHYHHGAEFFYGTWCALKL